MARKLVIVEDNPDPQQIMEWVHAADDDILACRGQGHAWPHIRPRKRLPKGIKAVRQHDGSYQIETTCMECGTVRIMTTLPGGMIDLPAKYKYVYPKGFKAPGGTSRRDCLYESWRRTYEDILATAASPEGEGEAQQDAG